MPSARAGAHINIVRASAETDFNILQLPPPRAVVERIEAIVLAAKTTRVQGRWALPDAANAVECVPVIH